MTLRHSAAVVSKLEMAVARMVIHFAELITIVLRTYLHALSMLKSVERTLQR